VWCFNWFLVIVIQASAEGVTRDFQSYQHSYLFCQFAANCTFLHNIHQWVVTGGNSYISGRFWEKKQCYVPGFLSSFVDVTSSKRVKYSELTVFRFDWKQRSRFIFNSLEMSKIMCFIILPASLRRAFITLGSTALRWGRANISYSNIKAQQRSCRVHVTHILKCLNQSEVKTPDAVGPTSLSDLLSSHEPSRTLVSSRGNLLRVKAHGFLLQPTSVGRQQQKKKTHLKNSLSGIFAFVRNSLQLCFSKKCISERFLSHQMSTEMEIKISVVMI